MKKNFIALLSSFLFLIPVYFAQAEVIKDFSVIIDVDTDAEIHVAEEITYDFGGEQRHGISRQIPYSYNARGGIFELRISDVAVLNSEGGEEPFSLSRDDGVLTIKIGDPESTVTGPRKYTIKYTVGRAINFFETYDELYWNVTGADWPITIDQSRVIVNLPGQSTEDVTRGECFSGSTGSTATCNSHRFLYSAKGEVEAISFIDDKLLAGQGFTIVAAWEKGLVKRPSYTSLSAQVVRDNLILVLPILTLILMLYLWNNFGRDKGKNNTIIAEFGPPDNLSPAETGLIVDEVAHNKDISSEIINLAVKGFLRISREIKGVSIFKADDYMLVRLKSADESLPEHEKLLLDKLFQEKFIEQLDSGEAMVRMSKLKENFTTDLAAVKKRVYQMVVEKGYFDRSPQTIRRRYSILGVLAMVGAWFAGPIFDWLGVIAIAVSGLIVLIFSFVMPQKNEKGTIAKQKILGLKEYLRVAEKDRIDFHNAPDKNPEIFEKLLPYAIVLGVEKEWAKQFEGIYNAKPAWYTDPTGNAFSALALSESIGGFSSNANAAMMATASKGGSGFSGGGSGGGFGGGGGGSW